MRLLPALILFAALGFALAPAPASACLYVSNCPCWQDDITEGTAPTLCYEGPGPVTNYWAYLAQKARFIQITDFWCRNNGTFYWITPLQREGCLEAIDNLCTDGLQCDKGPV